MNGYGPNNDYVYFIVNARPFQYKTDLIIYIIIISFGIYSFSRKKKVPQNVMTMLESFLCVVCLMATKTKKYWKWKRYNWRVCNICLISNAIMSTYFTFHTENQPARISVIIYNIVFKIQLQYQYQHPVGFVNRWCQLDGPRGIRSIHSSTHQRKWKKIRNNSDSFISWASIIKTKFKHFVRIQYQFKYCISLDFPLDKETT